MIRSAVISECGLYRYELRRVWDEQKPLCAWIMLNPSTADAEQDDPTIRKCIGFAQRWGCGGILIGNLFAFRATKPRDLWKADDPRGPNNEFHLERIIESTPALILAWGGMPNRSAFQRAARALYPHQVMTRVLPGGSRPVCFGRTQGQYQQPRHPLMLAYTTALVPY